MRRNPWLAAFILASTVSTIARAEPDQANQAMSRFTAVPPGPTRIESISSGTAAPYSGQLFDNPTALRWANYLQQCNLHLDLQAEASKKNLELQVGFWKQQQEQDKVFFQQQWLQQQSQVQALQVRVAQPSPWYLSPWAGFVGGLVTAGGLVALGAYLR